MATWQDGPEYAPRTRPEAFVTPAVEPLPTPEPPAKPEPLPQVEPHFEAADTAMPDLAALVPSAAPGRNPTLAFEVSTAAITTSGRPGNPSNRSPLEPFGPPGPSLRGYLPVQPTVMPGAVVNPVPYAAPGTPQWFAPPQQPAPAAPPAVTVGQIFTAVTPAVLISLVIGAVFSWLSVFMLALAFTLSARIAYRREAIRRTFTIAMIAIAGFAVLALAAEGIDADLLFETLAAGAQLACWLLPVVIAVIVASALRAGERPERLP